MVDYGFYTGVFHGTLVPPERWEALEEKSRRLLRQWGEEMTLEGSEEDYAMAVCALSECLLEQEAGELLRSASIGSVKVEYRVKSQKKVMLDRVGAYLRVYRGVG